MLPFVSSSTLTTSKTSIKSSHELIWAPTAITLGTDGLHAVDYNINRQDLTFLGDIIRIKTPRNYQYKKGDGPAFAESLTNYSNHSFVDISHYTHSL
jgi:hypothetical protein